MQDRKPPDVGARVRVLRQERGLSMRSLADLCDLSPNTISLIERGVTSPSVSTLHQLATALKVPITSFFEELGHQVQVIQSRPGERLLTGSGSLVLESLGSGLVGQSLEPFLVTLQPGADSGKQVMTHDGHEFVYCLEGHIEYRIEDRVCRLGAGESLLFEAWLPHLWCNPGDEPTVFLLVFQADVGGVSLEQHLHP